MLYTFHCIKILQVKCNGIDIVRWRLHGMDSNLSLGFK